MSFKTEDELSFFKARKMERIHHQWTRTIRNKVFQIGKMISDGNLDLHKGMKITEIITTCRSI